jgi:hypothetical protein
MDVEQKIDSAISEVMRLSVHAIRTAMVPLPFSGMIGTPTVSRLICEHVLQNFGFPKAAPEEIDEIMSRVVLGNLRSYMKTSLTQFGAVSAVAIGVGIPTMGIGTILGGVGCILATPPTARMLFKCACDMILILERSFRYQGRYVSIKQIEDGAVYYTTATTKTFSGKEVLLQQHVHDEVDRLIPLKKVSIGFRFGKLRSGLQDIIYMNRFDKSVGAPLSSVSSAELGSTPSIPELESKMSAVELDAGPVNNLSSISELPGAGKVLELPGDTRPPVEIDSKARGLNIARSDSVAEPQTPLPRYTMSPIDESASSEASMTNYSSMESTFSPVTPITPDISTLNTTRTITEGQGLPPTTRTKSESLFKRSMSKWSLKKSKTNV